MDSFISIFKDWPVLVQGAIGSALFWLVLTLFQKSYSRFEVYVSHKSLKQRKSWLVSHIVQLKALSSKEHISRGYYTSILVYRSLRQFYKAIMWLSLGLIITTLFYPLGVIGYMGCIYYMLKAFEVVKPIELGGTDKKDELDKLQKELNEVKAKLKHN